LPSGIRLPGGERRRRLLAIARQLFEKKGFLRTEIGELARRAGVTAPIIYRHFPGGKAEVFRAVLEEHIDLLLPALWKAMDSSHDPRESLYRGIDAYLKFAEENPDGFRLLIDSSPEIDPDVGARLQEVRTSIAEGLATTIADVMKSAGLTTDGAPVYAHALLGAVESVVTWWLASKQPDRDTLVAHLLAFLWRGFDGLPRDPTRFLAELRAAVDE
jgi:AcrR family transcriptional regulator